MVRLWHVGLVILALIRLAPADDGPKAIAIGDWSKPVTDDRGYALRGRLVLCERVVAADRREVAVYIELQDARQSIGGPMRIYCDLGKHDFRPEYKSGLQCELRDKAKQLVKPEGFPFSGGVPRSQWITLPMDATIRLRTTPFGMHRPGALVICPDVSTLWTIADDDANHFFLSGVFYVNPPDDKIPADDDHVWRGKIDLPPMQILSRSAAARLQ